MTITNLSIRKNIFDTKENLCSLRNKCTHFDKVFEVPRFLKSKFDAFAVSLQ